MNMLSTGQPSTLESYLKLCTAVFGKESPATQFIIKTIEESPNKEKEEVIAAESQMLFLLGNMHIGGPDKNKNSTQKPE